jgi:hypothetical protein
LMSGVHTSLKRFIIFNHLLSFSSKALKWPIFVLTNRRNFLWALKMSFLFLRQQARLWIQNLTSVLCHPLVLRFVILLRRSTLWLKISSD